MTGRQSAELQNAPSAQGIAAARAEWTTPRVIVSELRDASAHVAHGSDGSSSGYQYGS
jgi:hypothetical protein